MEGNQPPPAWSDRDLVVAFKSGDGEAYDEIYRRHAPTVRAVCARRLHQSHDAEEAVQETFLRAFQALPRFNSDYKLGAWLNRIAINVCIDEVRSRARGASLRPLNDNDGEAERGPEEIIASRRPEVLAALRELKPLHADALKMQALQGLSYEELADQLHISPTQVKSLLHRARLAFKRVMRDASGFALAPFAAWRRSRKAGGQPIVATNGALNFMGVVSAVHVSLPAAERLVTGALVAALAIGGTTAVSPTAEQPLPKTRVSRSPAEESKVVKTRSLPGSVQTEQAARAPGAVSVAPLEKIVPDVPLDELPIDVSQVQSVVAPVTETVKKKVDTYSPGTRPGSGLHTPLPVQPQEVVETAETEVQEAEGVVDNLTEGAFRKS